MKPGEMLVAVWIGY